MDPTISPAPTPTPARVGWLINRDYALLWTGGTVSVFGDFLFNFTLLVWVAVLTRGLAWSPLAISGILVAATLPMVLFGSVAGVFVDRWEKRPTMLWMDAMRAVLIGALVLAAVPLPFLPGGGLTLVERLGMLYGVVFLATTASQFFMPARFALIGDVVPRELQSRASGLGQVAQSVAMLLGPALAPALFVVAGPAWALGIDALTFGASFLTLLAIRPPAAARSVAAGERGHFWRELREGLSFAARNRVLGTLLVAIAIIMFGAAAINSLDILFALGPLHAPLRLYGLLQALMGVGMLGGAIVTGALAQRLGLTRTMGVSLVCLGALMLVYSRLTNFSVALPIMLFFGVFQAALNVVAMPLLLRVTPRHLLGRVDSLFNVMSSLVLLLGTVVAGWLAGTALAGLHAVWLGFTFGPVDTVFTGGAVISLIGAVYAIRRLGFRDPPAVATADDSAPVAAPIAEPLTSPVG